MTTVRKPLRLAANVVVNESDITKSAVSPCTRYTSSTHTDKRPLLESPPSMRTLKKQRALPIRQSNGDIRDSSVQAQQHDSINMDYPSDDDLIILLSSSDSAHESDISCPANDVMIILSSSDSESVSEPSDSDSDSMPVSHAHSHTDSHSDAEIVIRLDSSDDEFAIIISDSESIRSNSSGNVSSDDEDSVYQKKPMGPRTAIFFEEVYGKYYEEDPEMTCGSHKYDFTRSPGSELQYPDNERDLMDYDEHNVQVGDFVELNWDKDGKWMARVTAVSAKGIRFVNLYLANQTYIGAVGDVLMEELLFQTSECNCYHGWLHFDSIIRIISVSYTNQLTDGYDYFAPSYYCVDDFVFSNIPPEFLTSKGTPFDLCHCPNTDNELEWTVKNTNVNQMEAHAITLAKKRTFQPGKFYSLQNVPFDFEFRGTVLDDVVEIVEFDSEADEPILVVRVFERVENTINELRWTDVLTSLVGWKEIARVSKAECFVEYWDGVSQSFAVQYNGAGRRFFIRDEEQADRYPVNLPKREMRILDAFSGTGNYSKGIADSQIGTPSCAVDSWSYAIRSYNAIHNKQIAEKQCINEFLQDAAWEARNHPEQIKESRYDLVIASPPCQDYTIINRYPKESGRAIIVEIAHIVECLPELDFLIVENVTEFMRHKRWPEENGSSVVMFQRLIGFFLSFGMQVRFEVLNSGYHGSAQDRNRVIIIVAAKDKVLPEFPVASHYFDNKNKLIGSFIKTPDGLSQAGMKPVLSAPCRQITVNDCIGGLPPAVPYNQRPNPPLHFIDGAQEDAIPDKYRLKLNGMFRTITNSVIKNSPRYHPTENRMLSLYERARAQGFSDTDIEKLYDEYGREQLATKNRNALSKQIGNAVPRELAFAIGCAINFSLDQQQ